MEEKEKPESESADAKKESELREKGDKKDSGKDLNVAAVEPQGPLTVSKDYSANQNISQKCPEPKESAESSEAFTAKKSGSELRTEWSALANKIAGELVFSADVGKSIQKWRTNLRISQRELAGRMKIGPSVVSDYESGRRKSPGARMIRKIVECMLLIDFEKRQALSLAGAMPLSESAIDENIITLVPFSGPKSVEEVARNTEGSIVAGEKSKKTVSDGCVVIDSLGKENLSFSDLRKICDSCHGKASVFTKPSDGCSVIITSKIVGIYPSCVIFYGVKDLIELSSIALSIADSEGIPVIISSIQSKDLFLKRSQFKE